MKYITVKLTRLEAESFHFGAGNTFNAMAWDEIVDLFAGSEVEARAGHRAYAKLSEAIRNPPRKKTKALRSWDGGRKKVDYEQTL